jgi:hypothetical protein
MEIQATEWHKFGQNRTYLADRQGKRLGWIDNKTNELTVESNPHRAILEEWIRCTSSGRALPIDTLPESVVSIEPNVESLTNFSATWIDLNLNAAGQGVRALATEKRDKMRERSHFWTAVAVALDVKSDERAWRKGAEGEETVGARINRLTKDGWFVLHSIPVGNNGSDIDHVVIGEGGVFTINTKNHPGKKIWVSPRQIRVNGIVEPYLRNSCFEGKRASRLLSAEVGWDVPVKPILVFLTGSFIPNVVIKKMPDDVIILDRTDIPKAFLRAEKRLTTEQVLQVFEAARRSTTWR